MAIIFIYSLRSARESYGDNAVGYVELKREGPICTVQGKVCPEHRIGKQGYLVICIVNEDASEITHLGCEDCAASSGKNRREKRINVSHQ